MEYPGQGYMELRAVVLPVLFVMLLLWQYALEPRLAYFRNRGDYVNKTLVKAKFLILIGLVFIVIGSLMFPTDASLFFGFLFLAGGGTYLIQAIRIKRSETTTDNEPDSDDAWPTA